METHLADFIRGTPTGNEAEALLRKCVHCGFCNATCPTYQLFSDELDGPRGRIYLIKQMLETGVVTEKTRLHLDRCLTCRSCETTCPSGVRFSRLLDIGREIAEQRVPRYGMDGLTRAVLRHLLPNRTLFDPALKVGQALRPLLPAAIKGKVPQKAQATRQAKSAALPTTAHSRRMILLDGCVQPAMLPGINAATARVLDRLGISLVTAERAGCCGAVRFHLNDAEGARDAARRNIDAWLPLIDAGAEAIVITASGCGVQVRDYAHLLQDDPRYVVKAARVALFARDVSEVVAAEKAGLQALLENSALVTRQCLAFHAPCTLQHGLKIRGVVEEILQTAGFILSPVADSHLCCGSAGTYSVLQPEIATRLRDNKLVALGVGRVGVTDMTSPPEGIASANVGCIAHLASGAAIPVRHWIEWLDESLNDLLDKQRF